MDTLFICVCFLALFATPSFGQDDPLEVRFENATKIDVSEGAEHIEFTCHLNRGAMYVINNKVAMIHVDPVTSEETIISSSADLVEGKPEFYNVKINQAPGESNAMIIEFVILKVRYQDDGKYICKVSPGKQGTETAQAMREIVVHRPLSALHLKFGSFDPIAETPADPLKIDHGDYEVACIAEGSNPGTEDVHMHFHGLHVDHADPVITAMEGPDRKFSSMIKGKVNIMVSNSGQEIECQAKDSSGTSMSVKLAVSVNVYDPVVHCNDSEAFHGQDNPVLYCTVNHTDVEVSGYAYQIGETGEIIKQGDTHDKNIAVGVSEVAPGITIVSLDLHKAEHDYLDKNYYILIYLKGGHTSKEMVRLNKKEAPEIDDGLEDGENGAGRMPSAAFLSVLMCLLLWSL